MSRNRPADEQRPVTVRHRIEYAAARTAAAVFLLIGARCTLAACAFFGRLAYWIDGRHRRIAIDNIERSGLTRPDGSPLSPEDVRRIAKGAFAHFVTATAEAVLVRREIKRRGFENVVHVEGLEHLHGALEGGRGAILITGHIGNWELMGVTCDRIEVDGTTIYRPLDNPLLDRWIRGVRGHTRQEMVPKAEPALRDYPWSTTGEKRTGMQRARRTDARSVAGTLAAGSILITLAAFGSVYFLFGFIPLLAYVVARLFLRATSGSSHVTWPDFPCRTGGPIRLHLGLSESASAFQTAQYQLICWVEKPRRDWVISIASRWHLAADLRVTTPEEPVPEPGSDAILEFDCPDDAPPSSLRTSYRTMWELRVVAQTGSGPYDESFAVPVY